MCFGRSDLTNFERLKGLSQIYWKATQQRGMICSSSHDLGLPPEEQVGLVLDIIKAMPDPKKLPTFMKRSRSQSRPLTLSDYCRPVESPAEHSLFMECFLLHTNQKSKRTDWVATTREFNLRVSRMWMNNHAVLDDLFLKHEAHLRKYEKQLVLQASMAEANQTSSAISGLLASTEHAAGPSQPDAIDTQEEPHQPLQLLLRAPSEADAPQIIRGQGLGGKGGTRTCPGCSRATGSTVPMFEHQCQPYLSLHGKDPMDYEHCKKQKMDREVAQRHLQQH